MVCAKVEIPGIRLDCDNPRGRVAIQEVNAGYADVGSAAHNYRRRYRLNPYSSITKSW